MKKTVYFDRNGESGNIFYILLMVCPLLDKEDFTVCTRRVHASHSYEEALGIIGEYVHLEDLSK